jgi:hypothetical protein
MFDIATFDFMRLMTSIRFSAFAFFLLAVAALSVRAFAANADAPTNDLPNPYRTVAPWGQLPEGITWGALNSVAIDNDGESVWVATRCGANPDAPPGASPFLYDGCSGSSVAPVMKLDAAALPSSE